MPENVDGKTIAILDFSFAPWHCGFALHTWTCAAGLAAIEHVGIKLNMVLDG